MIEKAIFISKIDNLKYVTRQYTRLYFGNEFCQKLLPRIDELEKALCYCNENKLKFSLVTPYATDEGLKNIEPLIIFLRKNRLNCEVVINDWGVLDLLSEKYTGFQPILGRLLTKQSKDPRMAKLINYKPGPKKVTQADSRYLLIFPKKPPLTLISFYKESNVNVTFVQEFLLKQGISRIALDNVFQGIKLRMFKDNLSASLYIPYGYIATTRLCSANPFQEREKFYCRISPCRKECQKYTLRLINPNLPRIVYKKGNTLFFKNTNIPTREHLRKIGIDRLVYQPEIPL